jgi:predicted nucleotidyltransferase
MFANITIPEDAIADFCQKYHIRRLSLFGSVLRQDFRPDSDVDVLVEYEPGHVPGFISLSPIRRELSGILGRNADMRTPASLSDYFRNKVEASAVLIYERE